MCRLRDLAVSPTMIKKIYQLTLSVTCSLQTGFVETSLFVVQLSPPKTALPPALPLGAWISSDLQDPLEPSAANSFSA